MVTLSELKTRVRRRADMERSQFVSEAELTEYISSSYKELYDLLVATFEDYYTLDPVEFTLTQGQYTYDLPSDFYKLRGVDGKLHASSSTTDYQTLYPFNFNERNRRNREFNRALFGIVSLTYRIVNNKLYIYPQEAAAGQYRIWYVQRASDLVNDTDTVDGVNGWEEYIVIDAAIKMLGKEESDTTVLKDEKERIKQRIIDMAAERDAGSSERITDVTRSLYYPDDFT